VKASKMISKIDFMVQGGWVIFFKPIYFFKKKVITKKFFFSLGSFTFFKIPIFFSEDQDSSIFKRFINSALQLNPRPIWHKAIMKTVKMLTPKKPGLDPTALGYSMFQ